MKRGTIEHPKTLQLASVLKIHLLEAVGLLESLWHWTAKYSPRGDIGQYPDEFIAHGIHWHGKGDVIAALIQCRWVDRSEEHRLVVHDWHEHADDSTKRSMLRKGLQFVTCPDSVPTKSGQCSDNAPPSSGQSPDNAPTPTGNSPDTVRPHARSQSQCLSQSQSLLPPEGPPATSGRAKSCSIQGIGLAQKLLATLSVKEGVTFTGSEERQWGRQFDVLVRKGEPVKNLLAFIEWHRENYEAQYMPKLSKPWDLTDKWISFGHAFKTWKEERLQ